MGREAGRADAEERGSAAGLVPGMVHVWRLVKRYAASDSRRSDSLSPAVGLQPSTTLPMRPRPLIVGGATQRQAELSPSTRRGSARGQALSYTQQLRDFATHASANGLRFDLWVRPSTTLSEPLRQAVANGTINLRVIP